MRVAFVIGSLNFSGAEKVLSIVAQELYKNGNEIHVVLLEKEKGTQGNEGGIIIHGARATGNKIKRLASRWRTIRRTIKDIKPDVVVSFGSVCNVNTIVALLGARIPLVVCERNDPEFDPRKQSEKAIRAVLYPFSDGYVFQTERIKQYFSKRIQKRAVVIPNPIIDSGKRWNIENAEKKIVSVARLDDFQKDHVSMIKAFALFSVDHPDYRLELYGEGPCRDSYVKLIEQLELKEKVFLTGKTSDPTEVLLSAEIFLLTSVFEGMPNALMEAMSVGVPCISTDCGGGGAFDLVEKYGSGLLVQCGNVEEIAGTLSKLVANNDLKKALSKESVAINMKLGREKISQQWLEYLETVRKKG